MVRARFAILSFLFLVASFAALLIWRSPERVQAQDAAGRIISVENSVAYSSVLLGFMNGLQSGDFTPLAGLTLGSQPELNYTANDWPDAYRTTQIHELGHSLDIITSGSRLGTSEQSAKRLEDCIFSKPL